MIDLEQTANSLGLFGSLRQLGATAMAIVQNRLELMAVELKEEKTRAISLALWAAALIFLGFMSVMALVFTLVFIFWEQRLAVMGVFLGLFVVGAMVAFFRLKARLKTPPFAETISQFKKDRAWLQRR